MVAHGTLGTHPCEPYTFVRVNRGTDLRLAPLRCAALRRDAVGARTAFFPSNQRSSMRSTIGLTTILAALAFAGSTFAAANTNAAANTLTGTVGPAFTITMNKKTVKAGTYRITI